MPMFCLPFSSVSHLMLVVPAVDTTVLPFRSASVLIFDDFRAIQRQYGYLPADQLQVLSRKKGIPLYQINRVADFPRAKAGNVALIDAAIKKGDIHHFVNSEPKQIEDGCLVIETADGMARIECNRVIARIGAQAPRRFVESCGIVFASKDPTSFQSGLDSPFF